MKKFKEWRGTALMKKLKRFFASILCICMIITSCPDLLAWAAGDTAVVKPVTYRLTANSLSKMVRKAELEKTEENGLCKLKLPKGFNKTLGKMKLHVYLQPDEDSLVFVFENKADKRQGAALIVDNKKSDIFAIPTKAEIYEELGYEYASDSNADEEEIDSEGLLGDDFQDLEAEIVDDAATGSDNNADEKYDYLEGYATHTILNNKKHTTGVAFVVSLDDLGMDSLGELLPDEDDEITATDSNAETVVPGETKPEKPTTTVPAEVPTTTPSNTTVTTPSNATVVTVATPSNVAKTFIADVNGVTIRAHAEAGVLPEAATFQAIELKETGKTADAFKEACKTLDDDEDTEYDGVMAYDLHFLLDGEEVQPNGEVEITMEVSQKALPTDVDPSTIEVKHLAEDGDTLQVQTVADTADKVEGTVEVKEDVVATLQTEVSSLTKAEQNATAVKAEFKVDSFSYFVITYNNNSIMYVYLEDETGKAIKGDGKLTVDGGDNTFDPTDIGKLWMDDTQDRLNYWINVKETAETLGGKTQGYIYQKAYFKKNNEQQEVKWIYCTKERNSYVCYYSAEDDQPKNPPNSTNKITEQVSISSGFLGIHKKYWALHLVYGKEVSADSEITDTISQDGLLNYFYPKNLSLPKEKQVPDPDVTYVWYRSDNGTTWEQVEQKEFENERSNISVDEKGTHLFAALDLKTNDDKLRRYYRVEVLKQNKSIYTTKPFQIPYYAALQNGSFEYPNITRLTSRGFMFLPDTTTGIMWRTTGSDKQLELGLAYKNSHGVKNVPDETQFAELNAQAAGALYQEVITAPGSKLNWGLSHRGRDGGRDGDGKDTMYLVIAPSKIVREKGLTTQEAIISFINGKLNDEDSYSDSDSGIYIKKFIDGNKNDASGQSVWGTYQSTTQYEVPQDGYLTTFFFVAGTTSNGDTTVGNLLDDVYFTTNLPKPKPGRASLNVEKTVENLEVNDLKDYQVEITLEGRMRGNTDWESKGTATLSFKNGVATASQAFLNLLVDNMEYRIKETPSFKDNKKEMCYTLNKVEITGLTSNSVDSDGWTYFSMERNKVYTAKYINTYTPNVTSLTVKKQVQGNMGNKSENFIFKITVKKGNADITNAVVNDTKYMHNAAEVTLTASGENAGIFELADKEEVAFDKIPYGTTVTVEETGSGTGYTTTYIVDSDSSTEVSGTIFSYTVNDMKKDKIHSIVFINTRNIAIPTGLFDHGKPTGWWFLIIAAAGCLGFGVYRRKKKRNDGEECL